MSRPYVFRAPSAASCWMRQDLTVQVAADPITALLLLLIYRGSGIPFTLTRDTPTEQEQAA